MEHVWSERNEYVSNTTLILEMLGSSVIALFRLVILCLAVQVGVLLLKQILLLLLPLLPLFCIVCVVLPMKLGARPPSHGISIIAPFSYTLAE